MIEYLSEIEKSILSLIKEDYDKKQTNPLTSMDFKMDIKIKEDVPALLQEKGYIEINRTNIDSHLKIVSITLKDKFFEYFNLI